MATDLPNPRSAPELFQGVLTRRVLAYIVDAILISILTGIICLLALIAGLLTFGLTWLAVPFTLPIAVLIYYSATLGSGSRATVGMWLFDIVLTPTDGPPLNGLKALVHPVIYWLTIWIFWPLLFFGLFTQRRQLLHDIITGTLMVRRSPMQQHWAKHADIASYLD